MTRRIFFALFSATLLVTACAESESEREREGEEEEQHQPAEDSTYKKHAIISLPADTSAVDTAMNYIRFRADGQEVRANARIARLQMDSALVINITTMMQQDIRSINLFLPADKPGSYVLVPREKAKRGQAYGYYFRDYNDPMNAHPIEGELVITELDLKQGWISGSFRGTVEGEGQKTVLSDGKIVKGKISSAFQPLQ